MTLTQFIAEELKKQGVSKKSQPKKRGRPAKHTPQEFIDAWKKHVITGSLKTLSEELGISTACATVKASNLRKDGHFVPEFKRGRRLGFSPKVSREIFPHNKRD
jgi:hypothetical protein